MSPKNLFTVRRLLRAISELHRAGLHQTAHLLEDKITGATGGKHLRRDLGTGVTEMWDHNRFIAGSNEPL